MLTLSARTLLSGIVMRGRSSARSPEASACGQLGCNPRRFDAAMLIIMDEPTNHLDIESVGLLEQALEDFDGALLVVSHQPFFLERVRLDREDEVWCSPALSFGYVRSSAP